MTSVEDSKRRLIWHGMFLFLLGLLTGFVEQQFNNPWNDPGGDNLTSSAASIISS